MNIDQLLSELSLEEKASLCSGAGPWATPAIDRLGIPSITMSDGPHGMRVMKDENVADLGESKPATCFPTAACIGSSWNRELAREVAAAIAEEARAFGCNLVLGPGMNIKRTPLCGRNFEYYSEDPVLSGEMAAAFVEGSQSKGVGATIKHFVCNNTEFERMSLNVEVDERPLRELYLAGFERAIAAARPWAVMGAYNRVNGTFACEHPYLLQTVLKDEWGFDGLVMSDWTAVNDRVTATAAGLDLEMPGPSEANDRRVIDAVRDGSLSADVLDARVRRILTVASRAIAARAGASGTRESEADTKQLATAPDEQSARAHHTLARRAASGSVVLLKNSGDVLPLDPGHVRRLAVIGRFADTPRFQGGGSSKVNATRVETICSALGVHDEPGGSMSLSDEGAEHARGEDDSRRAVSYEEVEYAPGYDEEGVADAHHVDGAERAAGAADAALVVVGLPDAAESEGFDRENLDLPSGQADLIRAVAAVQANVAVVIVAGSVVQAEEWIDEVPAVCLAGLGGQAAGAGIVDVVTGRVNPSGRLTETMPRRLSDTAVALNYPGEHGRVRYGEGLFVGYRYHDETGIEPRYAFGHGLSYTSFEYGNINLKSASAEASGEASRISIRDLDELRVNVPVTNTGAKEGGEVVQLYVAPVEPKIRRPSRELKGFARLDLAPGESSVAQFALSKRDFAYYNAHAADWVVDSGEFELQVGSTSSDIRSRATVAVESTGIASRALDEWNPIRDWLEDPHGREVFDAVIGSNIVDQLSGGQKAEREMFLNIPLKKIPQLTGGRIPEEAISQMVEQLARDQ